ncbi:phosphohydrolase [Salipaludibacillus keqinensis]|uniref:Phosphohydrolase n=1 Tax=Salipaludibacillus keqinensis TaxID=2045207 RepID=A0A323TD55_9BACI|nr:HD-GYP domain-containing protein [Salipaludibacillus keqinensis]PYZ91807.1 phosphohydrolase [Salipaludibacillus keqinensis]
MNVNINELVSGCILTKDVWKKSNNPLMKKKTVLTKEHIQILTIFLVENVNVEPKLVDGSTFKPKKVNEEIKEDHEPIVQRRQDDSFINRYLKAVQQYKKLFIDWQGGMKVEAYEVRKVFLPLYEFEPTQDELMQLHHYTTKQDYIYFHSVAVSVFSYLLGKKLDLKSGEVIQLGLAGLLSDCGMSKLPFNVFEKKGSLTASEYNEVKKHPIIGYRMLEEIPGFSKNALLGILQHHEREDGSGYPLHIKRSKLHQYAKIISVADVFHAMTSERHYRSKQSPYKVIASLKIDQFGKLDHKILNQFIKILLDLSIGRKVKLSNGLVGEVLYQNSQHPTKPVVKVHRDEYLDLAKNPELFIEEELPFDYIEEA